MNQVIWRLWAGRGIEPSLYHPDSHDFLHLRGIGSRRYLDFRGEDPGGPVWLVVPVGSSRGAAKLPLWCLRFPEETGKAHLYEVTGEQERLITARMTALRDTTEPPLLRLSEWNRIWETIARGIPLRGRPYWAPPDMP